MNGLERRIRAVTRLTSIHDQDGSFDRDFWRSIPASERLELLWDLQIDYFRAPGKPEAAAALAALEKGGRKKPGAPRTDAAPLNPAKFRSRRWVTRPRPGVDRMACGWLIRRFIDPKARFSFSARPSASQVPFDMDAGEFSHKGPLCTFEVLARRFELDGPAVQRIGQIVHDLDMKETRYAPPEAPAVGRMVEGLRRLYAGNDAAMLRHGVEMFDALAASFESTETSGRPRTGKGNRKRGLSSK